MGSISATGAAALLFALSSSVFAETQVLRVEPEVEQRLGEAAFRLSTAARSFETIKAGLGTATVAEVDAFRQGLSDKNLALFSGTGSACSSLEVRYAELQTSAAELLEATKIRQDGDISAAEVPSRRQDSSDLEESDEDIVDLDAAEEPLEAEPNMLKPTGPFSEVESVLNYTLKLEALATDLEKHLELVRSTLLQVLNRMPSASSAASLKAAAFPEKELETVTDKLSVLNKVGRQLADQRPLTLAKRLGARLAQLQNSDNPGISKETKILSEEVDAAIDLARRLLRGEDVPSIPFVGSAKPQASDSESDAAKPISSLECTVAGVTAAAERFRKAAKGFQGRIIEQMMPPEADNLNRIVHTLSVRKSTLLQQLSMDDTGGITNADIKSGCSQFFAGVAQLEADLAHYIGRGSKTQPVIQEASQKTVQKLQLPPSQPLAAGKLASLELEPPQAFGGRGRQTSGVGKAGAALDVRSFR